jgi:hypothetical protein
MIFSGNYAAKIAKQYSYLRDALRVAQHDANLGGRHALARQLADGVHHIGGGGLAPAWGGALVGQSRGAHALAIAVHATHGVRLLQ